MSNIQRTQIVGIRHAEPMKDPETKRSLDCITEQGALDALEFGKEHADHEGNVVLYHSGMKRALQTAANVNVGMGTAAQYFCPDAEHLGLAAFKAEGRVLPSGIAYGPEFIDWIVANNPGISDDIAAEMRGFVSAAYAQAQSLEGDKDTLVVGVSHGPKVEMGYGMLVGIPETELGPLAAGPLDGFEIVVDRYTKTGNFEDCKICYKGQDFEQLSPEGLFTPKE